MEFISDEHSRRFGDDYVKQIIRAIKEAGKNSSGNLANSIDYRLTDTTNKVEFIFNADDYYQNVDEGRRPGSYPPIQAIAKWASAKGISKGAVFPIARSIYKFGIKPTNITKKVDNRVMNGKLFDDLEGYFEEGVEKEIVNILTQNNK